MGRQKSKPTKSTSVPRKRPQDFQTARLAQVDASWRIETLPTGLTLMHAPEAVADHFYLGVMIRSGARLENDAELGVSHFLEHMMFRGSKRYPEFTRLAEAFEWLGGEWNAATGHEHTEYWYSGIRHTAPEVVELFADFMESPKLTDIDVERAIILRELDGETNDHGHSTDLDYHAATLVWPGSPMARPILGTRASLAAMDVAKLHAYRERRYVPKNIAACAVGGGDEVFEALKRHFAKHRSAYAAVPPSTYPPLKPFKGPAVKWVEHSDNEYEIRVAFLATDEWSKDAAVYDIIGRILSDGFCSRLSRRMREELGLVYDIGASATLGIDTGTLDIHGSCAVEQLDEFLAQLFKLLAEFVASGPTEEELQRSIVRAIVGLELSPGQPEFVGARAGWATLCGRRFSLVEERERYKAVTVERVAKILKQAIKPRNTALVALGPAGDDVEGRLKRAIVQGLG